MDEKSEKNDVRIKEKVCFQLIKYVFLCVIITSMVVLVLSIVSSAVEYRMAANSEMDPVVANRIKRRSITLSLVSIFSEISQFIGFIGVFREKKSLTSILFLITLIELIVHAAIMDFRTDITVTVDIVLDVFYGVFAIMINRKDNYTNEA